MQNNNIEFQIYVKGRPITEFSHEAKTFVEGRNGSDFEIEVRNRNMFRIEAVISVDGLSITDGKAAGQHSSGYLIDPYGSVRIPGWKLNSAEVAKFVFAGRGQTYADAVGDSNNNGVIGLLAYREKVSQPVLYNGHPYSPFSKGIGGAFRGMSVGGSLSASASTATMNAAAQNIGTGFGDAAGFATRTVSFERGQQLTTMLIYYDDLRGLKARGVPMDRIKKSAYQPAPQAFPADMGCAPPPGWSR